MLRHRVKGSWVVAPFILGASSTHFDILYERKKGLKDRSTNKIMPGATSSFLLPVAMPGATNNNVLVTNKRNRKTALVYSACTCHILSLGPVML